jgi:hypothetical protein
MSKNRMVFHSPPPNPVYIHIVKKVVTHVTHVTQIELQCNYCTYIQKELEMSPWLTVTHSDSKVGPTLEHRKAHAKSKNGLSGKNSVDSQYGFRFRFWHRLAENYTAKSNSKFIITFNIERNSLNCVWFLVLPVQYIEDLKAWRRRSTLLNSGDIRVDLWYQFQKALYARSYKQTEE